MTSVPNRSDCSPPKRATTEIVLSISPDPDTGRNAEVFSESQLEVAAQAGERAARETSRATFPDLEIDLCKVSVVIEKVEGESTRYRVRSEVESVTERNARTEATVACSATALHLYTTAKQSNCNVRVDSSTDPCADRLPHEL